jgi:hypothetical protein
MALISNNRPKKLARPMTKTPLNDPDAVGFGTTLAKVLRSYLTPTARRRPGRGGRRKRYVVKREILVRESAHRQAANRAASGRSAVPQA